jgi:RNA polymerase subunit RPABC4/transcription elongation factor Spt4
MAKINYKICPRCNYIIHDDVPGRFCIQCGEKLLKSCKQCRAPIANPFALHCPGCGNTYYQVAGSVPVEAPAAAGNGPSSFRVFAK